MARMRLIKEAYCQLKVEDPDTALTIVCGKVEMQKTANKMSENSN